MNEFDENQEIVIDRRAIWIVILDRMRRVIALSVIFGLFFLLLGLDGPQDLNPEGYRVLCVFFLCVALWSTNLIPLSITSLLAMAAIPLLGIMDASQTYAYFGNKAVFFILGVFILSAALVGCGLTSRVSLWVLENFGQSPRRLMLSIYCFGAISSCFMSEHAVAAMLFPIVLEIVRALDCEHVYSRFAKSLLFALSWGCIIGGTTTVLGGGRVPLAVEILEKTTQGKSSLEILEYTWYSFPLVILLLACGALILTLVFPPEISDVSEARKILHEKSMSIGRMSLRERGIGSVMMVTLFLWFGYGDSLGIANIAIVAIVTLFVFNLITWKMVEDHVNWAIILMYGGAICLGQVMADSGAALWLAKQVFEGWIDSRLGFLMSIAVLSLLFTTFMNNSAVIAILLAPAISLCPDFGVSPTMAAMTVILPSNFAFILPIATPATALIYSSKLIPLKDLMRSGAMLAGFGLVCYWLVLLFYWPVIGFQ